LYTYPLCGLWTIASNTSAQEEFLKEHPYAGILINLDEPDAIEEVLNWADSNREELLQHRIKALALAKEKLNWEHESLRLQEYLGSLVNS
jgi:glycosyltransferase involved in cell wall biosynthesis